MSLLTERFLYYSLLFFWFIGLVMLIVQHPYKCKFFDLPQIASGGRTPENPHEPPQADWFFRLTHVYTLTPYCIFCCFLQLFLFTFWFLQLSHHQHIERRITKEEARGRAMREAGWSACLKSIFIDEDDDEELELDLEHNSRRGSNHTNGSRSSHSHRRAPGFRCVCGCCYCFSTAFALLVVNVSILLGLIYLLFLGYGTLESTSRSQQNPECRRALPTGVYIYVLNCALVILWVVVLMVRCLCSARTLAIKAVRVGHDLKLRVQQRKGRKGTKSRYAQLGGAPMDGNGSEEDGVGEIELELQEGDDDQHEFDRDQENEYSQENGDHNATRDDDHLGMESFLDEGDDDANFELEVHPQSHSHSHPSGPSHQLHQPKPQRHRPSAVAHYSSNITSPLPSATIAAQDLDDDTKEMMEMLDANNPMNEQEELH